MTSDFPASLNDLADRQQQLSEFARALAAQAQEMTVNSAGAAPHDFFITGLTVFVLACFVGYYVVWRVTPALHSPLMAVTNAVSSVIIVGALIAAGPPELTVSRFMGLAAVTLASINIFGGFIVTQRMLAMYKKKDSPGKKRPTNDERKRTMRQLAVLILVLAFFVSGAPAFAADMNQLIADVGSTQGRTVESALKQLQTMGSEAEPAVPAIIAMLKAKKTYAEQDYGLDNIVYPQAFQTLKAIGTQNDDVLQVAMDYYKNSADYLNAKPFALDVIAGFGDRAAAAVPQLAAALTNDSKQGDRWRIIAALQQIGPAAAPAMPTLIKIATTANGSGERGRALAALAKIAPHDQRVLFYAEIASRKPGNSGDLDNNKAFDTYVAQYSSFNADDLAILASYMNRVTNRDEAMPNHAGHIMAGDPAYLDVAKVFLNYPDNSTLIMSSLAARIRQLDIHTKDFRATLELAGEFGAHAAPLADAIYDRATSREHVTAGWLQPVAVDMLQKIGTPDAVEKSKLIMKR